MVTYIYSSPTDDIVISGFIAFLLNQGDAWDIRCVKSDMNDYHQQYYARMDAKEALVQELFCWVDFALDERLECLPSHEDLAKAGIAYLYSQWQQIWQPLTDEQKLSTAMAIYLDEQNYLYKVEDSLMLFRSSQPDYKVLIHGFPAQLLTFAACTTVESMIACQQVDDMVQWADMMLGWLRPEPAIMIDQIKMDIPDVYRLYEAYVSNKKAQWDAANRRRYVVDQPKVRYFMKTLLQQTREECTEAMDTLSQYLLPKQQEALARYMDECLSYITDHTSTRRKARSDKMEQYFYDDITSYRKQSALRIIKQAVLEEHNAAAALALEVKRLQRDGIMRPDIRPLTQFIAIVNATFGSNIKHDTFSKHFR